MCPPEMFHPVSPGLACLFLILNIFFPGVGTMVHACFGPHVARGICYGLLQMLLAPTLVGWVWSIVYGMQIVSSSTMHYEQRHPSTTTTIIREVPSSP